MVPCNLKWGEDSYWSQVWTSVPSATITGNYIHADKIFISGLGITGTYLWTENMVSVSLVLLVTYCCWHKGRSWLIQKSEEQDLALQQQLCAMPTDKGSQLGRETWIGLILVESAGAREDCSAQQPAYGTHMAFPTLISKWFQEARLSCHQPFKYTSHHFSATTK